MVFSAVVFVTLAICIVHDVTGHHFRDHVYEKMCDAKDTSFKEGLVKCLSEMPKPDQMILQFCGSVFVNETVEDFNALIDGTCKDESYAAKVAHCMDHVSHMVYHLNDASHHHDDDDGHDPHFDFGHGVYNEECFKNLYKAFNITDSEKDDD